MAKATAIFDGDDSRLSATIDRIDKKLKDLQGKFSKVMGFAAKVMALPAAAAAALAVGVNSALNEGGRLNDVSANTGIAIKDLMALEQEFKNSGKSAEDVPAAIGKMQKALAEGTAGATIAKLGLDLDKLRKMTPTDQFHALGAAINDVKDPAERSAAAMALFGKSGASLLSTFASKGFGEAAEQVGSQADILNQDAALFDSVSDKLALVGVKVQGFFVGVADRVAPVLNPLLDGFAKLDLASWGQQAGDVIAFLIQAFSDGSLWEILVTSGKISLMKVGNFLAGILAAVGKGLWQYVVESFKNGVAVLEIVTTAAFWKGLGFALLSAGAAFNALMLEGVALLLDQLAKVPGLGKVAGKGAELAHGAAASARDDAASFAAQAGGQLAPAVEKITGRVEETFKNIGDAIVSGFNSGNSLLDTGELEEKLATQVGKVMGSVESTRAAQLAANPTKPGAVGGEFTGETIAKGVGALQKIGLGGYGAGDPTLEESKRHTSLLSSIDSKFDKLHEALKPRLGGQNSALLFA
jgi:hypothetical protein